ncbi:MAG: Gfo/Idh/MocA family oxidoreductase [Clostridiales bacterium]|jgi:predicted dehydrogenase|nr:Gfo/Idh/MocA family oxidoreductase [Clostridiales bacterium]
MKKIKIAIIGAGGIAINAHAPAYEKMDNVDVVGVCDIIEERAAKMAKRFETDFYCTDYKKVFDIPGLDAVDICTPNYMHSVIAVDALEKGVNVFCEKPDAVSVAEAERMKDAAEKSGKLLMVMRNNRYLAASSYLRKFINDGKMGEIYAARCGWQRRRGIPGKGGWFTTKAMSGGGPLIDLGVHMIDLSIWLMGNPKPIAVSGCTYEKFANNNVTDSIHSAFGTKVDDGIFDVEDLAMGFIRFDNGACMQIEFSWASNIREEQRFFEFRGEKSGASWTSLDEQLRIYSEEYGNTVDYLPNLKDGMQIHEANLRHFVDVLQNGTEPMFVPQQGVDMIKILEGFYKSAKEGREVIL